jgi:hypothetical protein
MLSFIYLNVVLLTLLIGAIALVSASPLLVPGYIALWYLVRHRIRFGIYFLCVFVSLPVFAVVEWVIVMHVWPAPPPGSHVDLSGPAIRFVPMPSVVTALLVFPALYALLRYVLPNQRSERR